MSFINAKIKTNKNFLIDVNKIVCIPKDKSTKQEIHKNDRYLYQLYCIHMIMLEKD